MSKNILTIIILALMICGFGAYHVFANQNKEIKMTDKKILIAYYSYSGNTKAVAEAIQTVTGGDLFEIKTKAKYPQSYVDVVNQAKLEKQNDVRPELINNGDVSNYDVIFIGTPVWWYTMSPPVKTFLANNNFDGKTIVPFCTHGGGGASSTYSDMQKLAPSAQLLSGYTSYEKTAKLEDVKNWIKELKL